MIVVKTPFIFQFIDVLIKVSTQQGFLLKKTNTLFSLTNCILVPFENIDKDEPLEIFLVQRKTEEYINFFKRKKVRNVYKVFCKISYSAGDSIKAFSIEVENLTQKTTYIL